MAKKRKTYTWALEDRIKDEIPPDVRNALGLKGWNALGIYEAVLAAIRFEKKNGRPIYYEDQNK
jgi:hypothetical protein